MSASAAAALRAGRPALELRGVSRVYGRADNPVPALTDVSLALAPGTFTSIMGPSGSGKSTLLQCAAGLDEPDAGEVFIAGEPLHFGDETTMTKFRRQHIGVVFQQFNLLPSLTVLQNVTLPLRLAGRRVNKRQCVEILTRVGLADRLEHRPATLSGGQQQRVAIARALVTEPAVIFADEPTGALDTGSAREVLTLLREAVEEFGRTLVMVTHDPVAAAVSDAVLFLADGRLVDRLERPSSDTVAARMTQLTNRFARTEALR